MQASQVLVSTEVTPVFLAGIGDSEEEHWQRQWYRRALRSVWVEHCDWNSPVCETWVADLDRTLREVSGPKILIAHSLGCLLIPEWSAGHGGLGVEGAFLVAVPDAGGPAFPKEAVGFGSASRVKLPFPSTVVASEDDPYSSLEHAKQLAGAWGSRFVNIGRKGHVNLDSDLGLWSDGLGILAEHFGVVIPVETEGAGGFLRKERYVRESPRHSRNSRRRNRPPGKLRRYRSR